MSLWEKKDNLSARMEEREKSEGTSSELNVLWGEIYMLRVDID